jgi:hypothetical protein
MDTNPQVMLAGEGHRIALMLPCAAVQSRVGLAAALERLGYDVVASEPVVRAQRAGRKWSGDVRDCNTALTIRLEETGPHATRATFAYTVTMTGLGPRDQAILTREAEAAVALAAQAAPAGHCPTCGAAATDDSRFCRRCGAPVINEPAELEVLRLSATARAAERFLTAGTIFSAIVLLALLIELILGLAGVRYPVVPSFIALGWNVTAFCLLFAALRRLRAVTLTRTEQTTLQPPTATQPTLGALPTQPALSASVTEHTTELLSTPAPPARERVPIEHKRAHGDF